MVDETNKDETQNEAQAEVSDGSGAEQVNTENEPQNEELKADPSLTGPSEGSPQDPGDSMESVMDMYEESFKRFADHKIRATAWKA
jgi:hypothetical protein